MPQATAAQGGVEMNLSNLIPIPLAWAPYFMDFKSPYEALEMAQLLIASLDNVTHWTMLLPDPSSPSSGLDASGLYPTRP
jgi:hypothetical protein